MHPVRGYGLSVGCMEKPDACTLPTAEVPLRVAEFEVLFGRSLRGVERRSPERLRLTFAQGSAAEVRELTARESECCAFFRFELDGDVLDVGVPATRVPVLDGLERLARGR